MIEHYDMEYATGEFQWSGESQLVEELLKNKYRFNTVFDVGANIGCWANLISGVSENIHCFEPMPAVYDKLCDNAPNKATVNSFGLSDKTEWLNMKYTPNNDRLTTPCLDLARDEEAIILPLLMVDGDSYCRSRQIDKIDYLKIDTEGHEFKVVNGFKDMIQHNKIDAIQFEYGYANVLTKDLLLDFYKLLNPLGYIIGKLTPAGVHFKDYNLLDEDFRGPNYVAVSQTCPGLISLLQVSAT